MSFQLGDNLDFAQLEAQNMVVANLAAAPSSPKAGQAYYDTALGKFGVYSGGVWVYLTASVANAVFRTAVAGFAGELMISNGADRSATSWTTNGLVKIAAGIVAAAVAGTDYTSPAGNETLTNKTFNAASNTLSNLALTMFAASVIDTDATLTANSDTRLATQKATKAYIDNKVVNGVNLQGVLDASANPNYPVAAKGDMYKISVSGIVGGAGGIPVTVGDVILATAANAGGTQAAVGASWDVIEANTDYATTAARGLVQLATLAEAEAKSLATKALTPAAVANFSIKRTFLIGDAASLSFVLTHSLGTQDIQVQVRDVNNKMILTTWVATSTTQVTVSFAVAPALNSMHVTVLG